MAAANKTNETDNQAPGPTPAPEADVDLSKTAETQQAKLMAEMRETGIVPTGWNYTPHARPHFTKNSGE